MLGCVEPDLGVYSFIKTPEVCHLTIDTGASRTVFPRSWASSVPVSPTKMSKRGDFYWWVGAEKIMDKGGQVVTLEVDHVSRPLMLKGMVVFVTKSLVSALELRNAGWTLVMDDEGSRLLHRKSGECVKLLERSAVPVLPVRPRCQSD